MKLTEREIQVIQHISEGFCNKEIADRLGIAYRTVIAHQQKVMKKLKCKSIAHVITTAMRVKLIA